MKYIITIEDTQENSADFAVSVIAKEGDRHGTATALMMHVRDSVNEFTEQYGQKTEVIPCEVASCCH